MDYSSLIRIYRSGFALLPVVAKLDRYGDLGRDKSFPFTPNIDHVTRNSNSRASLSSSTFLSFLIGLLFFLLEAGYVVESLDDGLDS